MADITDVERLLGALKSAASPLQRMKLLALAWRTLRGLSPKQRLDLASNVGLEGAEEVLERLADGGSRMTPAVLLQALEKIKSADPRELQETVNRLRDPDRRGGVLERGLNRLADAVVGGDRGARSEPEPPTVPAAPAGTGAVAAPAVTGATAAAAAGAVAVRKTAPPRKRPVESRPAAAEQPEASEAAESRAPAAAGGNASSGPSLGERIEATGGVMARLRTLRAHLEQARGGSTDDLRRLIDEFPSGWARRRALVALLEARIPGDLHQAIFLVESLDSPTDRRWCLAAILRSFELADFEKQALLERHGSFVLR